MTDLNYISSSHWSAKGCAIETQHALAHLVDDTDFFRSFHRIFFDEAMDAVVKTTPIGISTGLSYNILETTMFPLKNPSAGTQTGSCGARGS